MVGSAVSSILLCPLRCICAYFHVKESPLTVRAPPRLLGLGSSTTSYTPHLCCGGGCDSTSRNETSGGSAYTGSRTATVLRRRKDSVTYKLSPTFNCMRHCIHWYAVCSSQAHRLVLPAVRSALLRRGLVCCAHLCTSNTRRITVDVRRVESASRTVVTDSYHRQVFLPRPLVLMSPFQHDTTRHGISWYVSYSTTVLAKMRETWPVPFCVIASTRIVAQFILVPAPLQPTSNTVANIRDRSVVAAEA